MDNNWIEHKPATFEYKGGWIDNWFSNFAQVRLNISGEVWPSVENYYQAMKSTSPAYQHQVWLASPSQAKKLGRRANIRADWDEIKTEVMMTALAAKFSQEPWRSRLIATGTEPIIEWNNWGDRIWGVTPDGIGENKLGLLLMKLRAIALNPMAI